MEDLAYKKILKLNKSITSFCINKEATIADAIQGFRKSSGLPLIVINDNNELIGSLSNGDVRKYLSKELSSLNNNVFEALNSNPHYAFDTDDISVIEMELSTEETRILPIITKNRQLSSVAYFSNIELNINNKKITYKDNYIYLIAEIGVNHNGNLNEAINLIDAAAESGFDAIKLQFRSESTYANCKDTGDIDLGTEYILEEIDRTSLSIEDEKQICDYIKSKKIDLIGTPFDEIALNRLMNYKPDAIKIASCDLTNLLLLKLSAEKLLPLILSTGMSNETEIIQTNQFLKDLDVDYCFLHCNSTYPAPIEDARLKYINRLSQITKKITGYSSHDGNQLIPLAAIGAGAKIIEVHITKDKEAKGTDHSASLEINELKRFVKSARMISSALGVSKPRVPTQGELINKISLGKSICYKQNLEKGHLINLEKDFMLRSPGDGIGYNRIQEFDKLELKRNVNYLDQIKHEDYRSSFHNNLKIEKYFTDEERKTLGTYFEWGIPVRYRDIEEMNQLFNPPLLEIHLSSKDLLYPINKIQKDILKDKKIVIHAIEQYHDGFILDLASEKKDIQQETFLRLEKLKEHCLHITDYFKISNQIKIVLNCGGFSQDNFLNKSDLAEREKILIDNLLIVKDKLIDFEILPQSMPPFPWHQGGRSYHNLLRSKENLLNMNKLTGLKICLDFSHTYMNCIHSQKDFYKDMIELIEISSHLHISDSSSSSNEGLNLDEGTINFAQVFEIILKRKSCTNKISLIPEVWQGHLNYGENFKIALERISRYISEKQ